MSNGKITKQEIDPTLIDELSVDLSGVEAKIDQIDSKVSQVDSKVNQANSKLDALKLQIKNSKGTATFSTPGNYNWVCPEGVSVVTLTMFGGGGGGSSYAESSVDNRGGFGGHYCFKLPISVVPGTSYPILVGVGGPGAVRHGGSGGAGGVSSAFGVVCNGGAASENNIGGTPDKRTSLGASPAKFFVGIGEMVAGPNTPLATGNAIRGSGGAGFGTGGIKVTGITVAPGFGGGGSSGGIGNNALDAQSGGSGIVIIEW